METANYNYSDLIAMDFELFYRILGRTIAREEAKMEQIKQQKAKRNG